MLSDLGRALAGGDRLELLETASVPDEPGLYAWWADRPGAAPDLGLTDAGAERPLYVGWARSLRRRIEEHLSPPHQQRSGSPLRAGLAQSLMMVRGVVPAHEGLEFARDWRLYRPDLGRSGARYEFAERSLTWWMTHGLSLSCLSMDATSAQGFEHSVIRELDPLLNIQGAPAEAFTRAWLEARLTAGAISDWENYVQDEFDRHWVWSLIDRIAGLSPDEDLVCSPTMQGGEPPLAALVPAGQGEDDDGRDIRIRGRWFVDARERLVATQPGNVTVFGAATVGLPASPAEIVASWSDEEVLFVATLDGMDDEPAEDEDTGVRLESIKRKPRSAFRRGEMNGHGPGDEGVAG